MNRFTKGALALVGAVAMMALPPVLEAQVSIQTETQGIISIRRGASVVVSRPDTIREVDIADPAIADLRIIPPNQLVVWGLGVGSTNLIVWGRGSVPVMYTIDVTADIASLQRELDELFPTETIQVRTTGSTVNLDGEVDDPAVARKALEVAGTLGLTVVNNLQAAPAEQILLHVQFAEVARSAVSQLGASMLRILNPETLDHAFDSGDTHEIETMSEGIVNLLISGNGSELETMIRALKNNGDFKSLAEPNLVTREGEEATFLAGGEFPFPAIQGGQGTNAVTIQFREYGIRLNFTPTVTNSGTIRLQVTPEVSSLDFANGVTFQGFSIPSLLTRRVLTDVELRPGQTLAIGGLLDNTMTRNMDKIPLLGDIPILGYFFKSEAMRENRSELLVLVTPYILDPNNLPAPPVPTGEAIDWEWDSHIGEWIRARADSTGIMSTIGSN